MESVLVTPTTAKEIWKMSMTQFLSTVHRYWTKNAKKVVKQAIVCYARAVDCTILPAISSIASTQAKATEETERRVKQLLDYLVTLRNAKVRFYVSKLVQLDCSSVGHGDYVIAFAAEVRF